LKSQPGGYLLLDCGPELLTTCVNAGLVDEFRPVVCPVALGRGISLFGDLQHTLRLELLSTASFASGAVLHRYQPADRQQT
jgi:riboflavin biosynthesis pyrimidine reductase